jgi:hypothetical protein
MSIRHRFLLEDAEGSQIKVIFVKIGYDKADIFKKCVKKGYLGETYK